MAGYRLRGALSGVAVAATVNEQGAKLDMPVSSAERGLVFGYPGLDGDVSTALGLGVVICVAVPDEDDELSLFQPFRTRLVGEPVEKVTLHRGVPKHLAWFLKAWIATACDFDEHVALKVALRLLVEPSEIPVLGPVPRGQVDRSYVSVLQNAPTEQLLDVVDAILFFHRAVLDDGDWFADYEADCLDELRRALEYAGSAFRVADNLKQLVERVDASVTAAAEQAAVAAEPTAAELLRDAWRQVYGRRPDPTTAYRQAVRAVEQVACPLVLPNNPKATLGMVISHLRDAGQRWSVVLVDKDNVGTIEPLVVMVERLWSGQVSRHGGGRNSRDQTQQEAEAAVHLAVVMVQWLTVGVLRKIGENADDHR